VALIAVSSKLENIYSIKKLLKKEFFDCEFLKSVGGEIRTLKGFLAGS